jgi:signal transduction histidine kinase
MTVEHGVLPRAMSLAVHELRTPVTVVAGYLRMLLREQAGPLSEKQKKMLEEADRSCSRLGALVAEMSEFGKLEGGEVALARQDFDLAALAAELASGLHDGVDRGVQLEARAPAGIKEIRVAGDRTRIAASIKALMQSAVRERVEPGILSVRCSVAGPVADGPVDALGAGTAPRWAVLAIGDDAAMPELERVALEPPDAFDEWRGGLGLALPVARRVIEKHGGAVWCATGPAARATAALRLPLIP